MSEVPTAPKPEKESEDRYAIQPEGPFATKEFQLPLEKGTLGYKVTSGMLPLRDDLGVVKAGIYHTSYTISPKKDQKTQRPVTFTFNGGPGSSSVWLHLGALGPKRVALDPEGFSPERPFQLKDNPLSWLSFTDLVFIDPVGTGFSRSVKKEDEKGYWGLKGDVESIGEFIRTYLNVNHRWTSPLYIAGESYGTTRAAGLSDWLFSHGIALEGIVLISSILNFQTARFTKGNDLPYLLFLPTYTATAYYHKQLPKDLQSKPLSKVLAEVEKFVEGDYAVALWKGTSLPAKDRAECVKQLARFTGLDPQYVDLTDLRIQIHRFCKELLRKQRKTVGRLDSRYTGLDALMVGESIEHDPSSSTISAAFTACINDWLRREVGYAIDLPYYVSNPGQLWQSWEWGSAGAGYPDTSEALRSAMSKNPNMKVLVTSGYFDLATPYYATEYTKSHLGLEPSVVNNIQTAYYESGHMMYVHEPSMVKMHADVSQFYR